MMDHLFTRVIPVILGVCFGMTASSQIQFIASNHLLAESDLHSAVPVAVTDMNGDGMDDIIAMDEGQTLYVQYQTPDPKRPFVRYEVSQHVDNGEQNDINIADFNNDGVMDILTVGTYDRIKIFTGIPNSYEYQLTYIMPTPTFFSQGASMGDFNQDGWADAMLLNDNGTNIVLMNDGAGSLVQQSYFDFNSVPPSDNSGNYGSVYTDFDMDGDVDLYIAKCRQGVNNPSDPRRINVLFVNDGSGQFTENARDYGLASGHQTWTADFGDIDNDGDLDCFMTQHNVICELYENIDNDTFVNITSASGINIGGVALQGMFRDFDNDGYLDVLVSGNRVDYYKNNGDRTFTRQDLFGSIVFGTFAMGDLNHDGFTDIYASRVIPFNQPDLLREDILYLNSGNAFHYISVEVGQTPGTNVVGTLASLYGPWGIQTREIRSGEQYGVSNTHKMHFGLGFETSYDSLVIRWPDGSKSRFNNLAADQHWIIQRDGCVSTPVKWFDQLAVLCEGDSLQLHVQSGYALQHWSNGPFTDTIVIREPGLYFARLVDQNDCMVQTWPIEVGMDPDTVLPRIMYDGSTILCRGEEAEIVLPEFLEYAWSNGANADRITVTESGSYFAEVTGYCKTLQSDTITFDFLVPDAPVVEPVVFESGEDVEFIAVGGDSIVWYSDPAGMNQIGTGDSFIIPDLSSDTTIYAQNIGMLMGTPYATGIPSHNGTKYNASFINGGLIFTVHKSIVLNEVTAYTDSVGQRIVEITGDGGFLWQKPFDLSAGLNVLQLDAALDPGEYTITTNTVHNNAEFGVNSPYLWRSDNGILYPYVVSDVMTLDNSTYGEDFYYYFYNWKLTTQDRVCTSVLVEGIATLDSMVAVTNPHKYAHTLLIHPNPSSDFITFSDYGIQPFAWQILNASGEIVASQHEQNGMNSVQFDVTSLPQGMYIVRTIRDEKTGIGKWIRL